MGASIATARASTAPADQVGQAGEDESVTNVQHAGVDEGGIVKVHGNHLVVLAARSSVHHRYRRWSAKTHLCA